MKPGKESTEHARAWRAETLGAVIIALGMLLAFVGLSPERTNAGVVLVAIGAALVAITTTAYSFARGGPKAAAARPAAVHAQPRV